MTRFRLFYFMCILVVSTPAQATSGGMLKAQSCTIIEDAIVPLKPPTFDMSVEWRRVLGMEGYEHISDVMALADGGIIAVGEGTSYSRTDGAKPPQLYVIRLDQTGKLMFEKRIEIKNFVSVVGAVILKDRIIVASHLQDDKKVSTAQLDYLDGAGAVKATYKVADPKRDLIPADIVIADAATLFLGVTSVNRTNTEDAMTVLYKMNADGKIITEREYLPGVKTRLNDLQRLSSGQIAGVGRIHTGEGRESGWLLQISKQGDLLAQRPYARGSQAQLLKVVDDGAGGLYAVGESIPSNGSYRAAWVMHVNANGAPIWQRFLTGKYRYSGTDLVRMKDGRIQVLMAGRPVEDGGREHARILTLSPTGDILQDEAYLEGTNAIPSRLLEHTVTKQRFLAGVAQTGLADYGIPESQKMATYDAWITGLPGLPSYEDPCKPRRTESLDD